MAAIQLNIIEATQARDKGIQTAMDSADSKSKDWSKRAYEMFTAWLQGWPSGYRFQMEGFRQVAQIRGLPKPPSARSFGGIALKAKGQKLIRSCGRKATKSVTAHSCFATEWEKI